MRVPRGFVSGESRRHRRTQRLEGEGTGIDFCRPDESESLKRRAGDVRLTVERRCKPLFGLSFPTFFLLVGISLLTFCGGSPYKAFIDDGGGAGAGWTGC